MMDIRHNQIAAASRVLQAHLQLEQAQRDQAEAARSLAHADNERRTELLKQLQAASVKSKDLQAQLRANGEKLLATGLLKSQLVRGPGAEPIIHVFRSDRKAREVIDAGEDTPLLPGDTIEIALRNEFNAEVNGGQQIVRSALASDRVLRP
jgi:polysaccharide export outer membrane protein